MTRNKESNTSHKFVSVRTDDRDGRDQRSYTRTNNNSSRYPNNNNRRETRPRDNFKPDPINRPPRMSNRSDEEEDRKVVSHN